MRFALLMSLLLGSSAVAALAQTGSSPSGSVPPLPGAAAPASPAAPAVAPTPPSTGTPGQTPAGRNPATDAIADCIRLWDAATHMSKQEWAATCKRVQTRLDNLKIEGMDIVPKAAGPKARRQGAVN
jgi:hypothetical protein